MQWDVRRSAVQANLAEAQGGLERAREAGVELVLLPEMWATSFPDAGDDVASLVEQARDAASALNHCSARTGVDWAGSGFAPAPGGGALPVNRLELFAGGEPLFAYDKVHLFGPTAEDRVFRAGARLPQVVSWRGVRVSGAVCYDLRFPELTRAPFLGGAELLLVPAQWPSERAGAWRALVHGLAASGQCVVLAANRTGVERVARRGLELQFSGNSLCVDAAGVTLAEGRGEAGLVIAEFDPAAARQMQQRIPVRRDRRPDVYVSGAPREPD